MEHKITKDLAYRILELERRLAAYRQVHDEELNELESELARLKSQVLASIRELSEEGDLEVEHDLTALPAESHSRRSGGDPEGND